MKGSRIDVGIRGSGGIQLCSVETWALARFGSKLQAAQIVHGQREDLPVLGLFAGEGDVAGDSLALAANDGGEIDAAGVLDQDVERGWARSCRQLQVRRAQAAIERADEFLIEIHLRVIVEA